MSLVILLAALLAGLAGGLMPAGHGWPRARWTRPAAGAMPGGWGWRGVPWVRQAKGNDLDAHVAAIRQMGALLCSGRNPAEAWALLETTWSERLASATIEGQDGGLSRRRRTGADSGASAAAHDLVDAARAALIAHDTGAGPSVGIERHLQAAPRYRHAWIRLSWCIRLSESTGAALGDLLNRLASQLEAEQDRRRALDAILAGPRMTQKLLAWLPALGLGLAQLMGADPFTLLTGTSLGRVCLAAGAGLWWANAVWCRRLLGSTQPAGPGRVRRMSATR